MVVEAAGTSGTDLVIKMEWIEKMKINTKIEIFLRNSGNCKLAEIWEKMKEADHQICLNLERCEGVRIL